MANIWAFEPYMQAFLPIIKDRLDFIATIKNQEVKDVAMFQFARQLADSAVSLAEPEIRP